MNYYVSKDNENYTKLKNFMTKHGLVMKGAFAILQVQTGGGHTEMFTQGKFIFPNREDELRAIENLGNINTFISFVATKTACSKPSLSSACLKKALTYFFNLKCLDFNLFMKKLEVKLELFRTCSRVKDYMELFARIYNYNNRNPISLDEGVP